MSSRIENTTPALKTTFDAEIKSSLQVAAETLQTFMKNAGYENYTVTVTAETISIGYPNSIDPPPKQTI